MSTIASKPLGVKKEHLGMSKHQTVAYIRVSSVQQNTDRQLVDVERDKEFVERVSAKDTERPQLKAMLEHLREGDTVVVHSMDRLARNTKDLLEIVEILEVVKLFWPRVYSISNTDIPIHSASIHRCMNAA
jgi:predicted site-specific integrase-resolvase